LIERIAYNGLFQQIQEDQCVTQLLEVLENIGLQGRIRNNINQFTLEVTDSSLNGVVKAGQLGRRRHSSLQLSNVGHQNVLDLNTNFKM
jgi:hypothetical protein